VQKATELDHLRLDVGRHLAVIEARMSEHLASEEQRHREASANEQALRERLGQVEQEAGKLRQEIALVQERALVDAVTICRTGPLGRPPAPGTCALAAVRRPLSLAVFDVDNFKSINDRFGTPPATRRCR